MAVQTDSGGAVSIALGADEGGWLLGPLLPLLPPGSLGDGSLISRSDRLPVGLSHVLRIMPHCLMSLVQTSLKRNLGRPVVLVPAASSP
jgi:hypothetical protein